MKIAVDIDNVLSETMRNIVDFHNSTYNTSFKRDDFLHHGLWKTWGGTRDEAVAKIEKFFKTHHFDNIKPVLGAKDGVSFLKNDHDLCIITSRPDSIKEKTREWICKHFPEKFNDIHLSDYYDSSKKYKSKGEICEDLDIDILIEDCIEYALGCAGKSTQVLLFDHPWNQTDNLPKNIHRVHSWEEIKNKISEF
jgi:uncharacterized HAD superfamily protein